MPEPGVFISKRFEKFGYRNQADVQIESFHQTFKYKELPRRRKRNYSRYRFTEYFIFLQRFGKPEFKTYPILFDEVVKFIQKRNRELINI